MSTLASFVTAQDLRKGPVVSKLWSNSSSDRDLAHQSLTPGLKTEEVDPLA